MNRAQARKLFETTVPTPAPWSEDSAASKSKCGSSPYPVNETLEERRR